MYAFCLFIGVVQEPSRFERLFLLTTVFFEVIIAIQFFQKIDDLSLL